MKKFTLSGIVSFCLLLIPLFLMGETKTDQFEKSFTIDESKPVFLEFKEGDGNIKFSSWDKNIVQIRVKKVAKERDEKRATELLSKVKVNIIQDGNSIDIEVVYPKIRIIVFGFRDHPRVEVSTEIMLPSSTNLTCSTDDGDIHLSGRLDWLDVRAEDGDIRIQLFRGSVMTRDWKIRTDDGDVELSAPQDFAARIRIKTDDGNIESELPLSFSKISSDKDLSGRLNQGDQTIIIETEDGNIFLLPTKK